MQEVSLKIALLGDKNVGKSCIYNRFLNRDYNFMNTLNNETINKIYMK